MSTTDRKNDSEDNQPEIRGLAPSRTEPLSVTHHADLRRFDTLAGDGPSAFLAYTLDGNCATFVHTLVPEGLRGRGVAARLVRAALDEARKRCWKVVPRCSYVAAFIERNPEFADLVEASRQRNAKENTETPSP